MNSIVRDAVAYLKAVFAEGKQWVFTLFDILGIILFLSPSLALQLVNDVQFARTLGATIFFISFIFGNFVAYRKLLTTISSLNDLGEESLLLYPYANPPYNSVEMRYVGQETIKDFHAKMIYNDKDGNEKVQEIIQFFPENDRSMALHSSKLNVMSPDQIARFHLLKKESTLDGKVRVALEFTGTRSGKHVYMTKDFMLDARQSLQIF